MAYGNVVYGSFDAPKHVDIQPPAATATADAPAPVLGADIRPPAAVAAATAAAPVVAVSVSPPAATATATAAVPSLTHQRAFLTPPTREEAVDDHFWGRYSIPVGQSVVLTDGHYATTPYPWLGDIAPLEQGVEWFQGGRTYEITDEVALALEADGYTVERHN